MVRSFAGLRGAGEIARRPDYRRRYFGPPSVMLQRSNRRRVTEQEKLTKVAT
jgi:hypothetical protein